MKKDRNTFFSNYNAQTQSYFPEPQFTNPFTSSNISQAYYQGPNINESNDFDNRISKLERQVNRLDNRLSKLENTTPITQTEEVNYNNMYML